MKADFDRLRAEVQRVQDVVRQQTADLQVQFTRIAEMQAILDEQRLADIVRKPRPLFPAKRR